MPYKISAEMLDEIWDMPALSHYPDRTVKFSFADSHVIQFLQRVVGIELDDAKRAFEFVRRNGDIVFDPTVKKWMGKHLMQPKEDDRYGS